MAIYMGAHIDFVWKEQAAQFNLANKDDAVFIQTVHGQEGEALTIKELACSAYISFGDLAEEDEETDYDDYTDYFGVPDHKIFYSCTYKEFMEAVNGDRHLDEVYIVDYELVEA